MNKNVREVRKYNGTMGTAKEHAYHLLPTEILTVLSQVERALVGIDGIDTRRKELWSRGTESYECSVKNESAAGYGG